MGTFEKILIVRKSIAYTSNDDHTEEMIQVIEMFCANRKMECQTYPNTNFEDDDDNLLIVSIGGDGTMLQAMNIATEYEYASIIGLNTGTLGFLVDEYSTSEVKLLQMLDNIHLNNMDNIAGVKYDYRSLLSGVIVENDKVINLSDPLIAVNELMISGGSLNAPIITKVYINGLFVSEQMGSGTLVSSPTGSTAMSLSAGGAIVHPSADVHQIVPISAHTLTSRPVITSSRDLIELVVSTSTRVPNIEIHADGKTQYTAFRHDKVKELRIQIQRHVSKVKIYRPENWNFFEVLKTKMKW